MESLDYFYEFQDFFCGSPCTWLLRWKPSCHFLCYLNGILDASLQWPPVPVLQSFCSQLWRSSTLPSSLVRSCLVFFLSWASSRHSSWGTINSSRMAFFVASKSSTVSSHRVVCLMYWERLTCLSMWTNIFQSPRCQPVTSCSRVSYKGNGLLGYSANCCCSGLQHDGQMVKTLGYSLEGQIPVLPSCCCWAHDEAPKPSTTWEIG